MPSKLQKEVKDLYKQNGWDTDPTLLLVAMQEELGELCARWLYEHPGYEKSSKYAGDSLEMEVGDLINLIIAFCNTQGIDFEKAVRQTIKKRRKQHLRNAKQRS